MSWAERLRATLKPAESQDRCKSKKDDDQKHSCSPCEFNEVVNKSRGYCSRNTSFHFGRLPPDMWVLIFSFLNFREVQNVSCTCSLLWKIAHSRDSIWAVQLEYFRRDILSLRGDGRLLCTELVTSSFTSAYDKLKVERMLYDIDTRREWHFKDREGTDSSQVIFSCPLVLDDDNHEGSDAVNYGWGNEPFVPLDRVRIFRAVPLTLSRTDAFLYAGGGDHLNLIYEPSEYVMLCDCINRGDFTASRVGVLDCTEEEDQLFLLALRSTFHHAKQRSPPRSSRGEPRPFQHLFLRHFSGKLLSICRYEAEQILESLLRLPNVLDNFVVRSDQWRAPCFSGANSTPQMQTHYFIAPELCRHERIGLIIVDSVRMLVVLGRERVHQFDAQWGGEYEVSGGRGHSTPGEEKPLRSSPRATKREWLTTFSRPTIPRIGGNLIVKHDETVLAAGGQRIQTPECHSKIAVLHARKMHAEPTVCETVEGHGNMGRETVIVLPSPATCIAVTSEHVWVTLSDGGVEVRDLYTSELVHCFASAPRPTYVMRIWSILSVPSMKAALHVWMGLSSGAIEVYDAQSFVLSHRRTGHAGGVYCLAEFGGYVYSGSSDFKVGQWDAEGAQLLRMLHGHSNYVRCLYAEGNAIVSGSDDCTVRVWDVGSGTTQLTGHFHGHAGVSALCRVGVTMWSGDDGGRVVAWRLDTCEALHVLQVHSGRVTSLRKVGSRVYSGGADGVIVVYDAEESRVLHRIDNHKGAHISSLQCVWECSRYYMWTAAVDNSVRCWHYDEYRTMTQEQERANDMRWYYCSARSHHEANLQLVKQLRELMELVALSKRSESEIQSALNVDEDMRSAALCCCSVQMQIREIEKKIQELNRARSNMEMEMAKRKSNLESIRNILQQTMNTLHTVRGSVGQTPVQAPLPKETSAS